MESRYIVYVETETRRHRQRDRGIENEEGMRRRKRRTDDEILTQQRRKICK